MKRQETLDDDREVTSNSWEDCCGNHLSQWQMTAQMSKSLRSDIMWEFHKRTQQGVSAKLESYIYKIYLVRANNN